ncbi:MAG: hypothetical protein EP343_22185 [Deltaproteobacteria bacterium]|nr:MAG: hypothetical protein EP343_22185 [Deltaproteobacteria bacterium]
MKWWAFLLAVGALLCGSVGCIEISSRFGDGQGGLSQGVVPTQPKEPVVTDASTPESSGQGKTTPSGPEKAPQPPLVPDTAGTYPSCAPYQTPECQTDADCPTGRPHCSNGMVRQCLKCKAEVYLEGSSSSCKPPELWRKYSQSRCGSPGFTKLAIVRPCDACGGGSTRYVLQVCVPQACSAP